jgi:hypothetical protein
MVLNSEFLLSDPWRLNDHSSNWTELRKDWSPERINVQITEFRTTIVRMVLESEFPLSDTWRPNDHGPNWIEPENTGVQTRPMSKLLKSKQP